MNLIIDEWDINAEQSKCRKVMSELVVERMKGIFWDAVQEECYGCHIKHPSQHQHLCLTDIDRYRRKRGVSILYIQWWNY